VNFSPQRDEVGFTPAAARRHVAFVAFDDMRVLDLTGALDAFSFANDLHRSADHPSYVLHVVSESGGTIRTSAGLSIVTAALASLDDVPIDTLIIAGGASALRQGSTTAAVDAWLAGHVPLIAWIAARAPNIRRVCSVCTGVFLLAAARQLAGRRVSTHWAATELLRRCFPQVLVEPDRIYVADGAIWTSGGVTSGIDLALALIEDDLGSTAALDIARVMVVFVKRPGGQSQFSAPLAAQLADGGTFAALHAWMSNHLGDALQVEQLAAQASMSRRTFMRAYAEATGWTPGKALEAMRLAAARTALEQGRKSLKQIARETGFGDEARMRRAFQREVGVNPTEYRARFAQRGPRAAEAVPRQPRVRGLACAALPPADSRVASNHPVATHRRAMTAIMSGR
jgi:transcriptional regulator GlxA family with amidase domain